MMSKFKAKGSVRMLAKRAKKKGNGVKKWIPIGAGVDILVVGRIFFPYGNF